MPAADDPERTDDDGADGVASPGPSPRLRVTLIPPGAEGAYGQSPLLGVPDRATPLDPGEPGGPVPTVARWAMEDERHALFSPAAGPEAVRWVSPDTDPEWTTYAIDDGRDHCMVARLVGDAPGGCTYCLVTRVSRLDLEEVRHGQAEAAALLSLGRRFTLCGVIDGPVANVVHVARWRRFRDVPAEYRPGAPFLHLAEPL